MHAAVRLRLTVPSAAFGAVRASSGVQAPAAGVARPRYYGNLRSWSYCRRRG